MSTADTTPTPTMSVSDLPADERCPECGQPDNCGDCNHVPLTDDDLRELGLTR